MFCNYCLQLLNFSQGVTPHAPQERPLRGDTRGFSNAQPRQRVNVPSLYVKLYEDNAGLETNKPIRWRAPVHQDGLQALLSHSTVADCNLCAIIFNNISASLVGALRRLALDDNSRFFVYKLTKGLREDHTLSIWLEVSGRLLHMIELQLTFKVDAEAVNRIPFYESPDTGSIGTSILAASWLENCLTNHRQCKCRRDKGQRPPSRLIDIGDANGPLPPRIWSPGTDSVPYMTLSHRWGTDEQIMLTKASLPEMSKLIDVAKLSQTYQDAIAITRSLGLRYLWIDSLCIIQDSITDWQTEAARMGDIFRFSTCTIAASWASSNSDGCFFDRGPLYAEFSVVKAAKSPPQLPSNVRQNIYRRRRNQDFSGTMPISDIDSKKIGPTTFDCVLERRRSELSTEIAEFSHNLLSSSLTHSISVPVSTKSPAIDTESVGDRGSGTSTPEITSHPIFMTKHDDQEQLQSGSSDRRALETSAKICINSQSERHSSTSDSATQQTLCKPGRTESAVLYILPFQRDLWEHSVELSPLSRRAWVLQERLLSPRTLHYTKTQLFWECRESKACESSPHPYPKNQTGSLDSPEYMNNKHQLFGLNAEPLHRHWPEIIEKYTDTLLTKLEDKLIAISGLARQVFSITKDKYCAGIWREDLVLQLLWRLQRPQYKTELPYRAPSWSWASTEGKVDFIKSPHQTTSELKIKIVQSIGVDGRLWSFDQIEYGSIRARGVMRAAQSCIRRGQGYKLLLTDQIDEELDTNECDYYPDSIPQSLSKNSMCLPVACHQSGASAGGDENDKLEFVAGLVIEPTGDYADEYRRLGLFRVAASAGIAYFGLNLGRPLRDVTLV